MTPNRFVTPSLCLGLCLAFVVAFAPAARCAEPRRLQLHPEPVERRVQDQQRLASLASACKDQEIWQLSQVSGKTSYCIKNQSNGQYLENKATKLSSECNGDDEYWNVTPVSYQGETFYCVQNVGNSEYLTSTRASCPAPAASSSTGASTIPTGSASRTRATPSTSKTTPRRWPPPA